MTPQFLKPEELRARWGDSVSDVTLRTWRMKRQGPPFVKFGRRVLYPLDRLVEWENKQVKE